jgi:hypothetical protein
VPPPQDEVRGLLDDLVELCKTGGSSSSPSPRPRPRTSQRATSPPCSGCRRSGVPVSGTTSTVCGRPLVCSVCSPSSRAQDAESGDPVLDGRCHCSSVRSVDDLPRDQDRCRRASRASPPCTAQDHV